MPVRTEEKPAPAAPVQAPEQAAPLLDTVAPGPGGALSVPQLIAMQQGAGNAAVAALLSGERPAAEAPPGAPGGNGDAALAQALGAAAATRGASSSGIPALGGGAASGANGAGAAGPGTAEA